MTRAINWLFSHINLSDSSSISKAPNNIPDHFCYVVFAQQWKSRSCSRPLGAAPLPQPNLFLLAFTCRLQSVWTPFVQCLRFSQNYFFIMTASRVYRKSRVSVFHYSFQSLINLAYISAFPEPHKCTLR